MRYVALARAPLPVDERVSCKTSLILSTRHEKGALLRCLQVLGEYGLSLTKLESRPRPNRPWEYMFFVDFEGNVVEPRVATALEALRTEALYLKVLGCYPGQGHAAGGTGLGSQAGQRAPRRSKFRPPRAREAPPRAPRNTTSWPTGPRDREDTIVRVGDLLIGGDGFVVMAGPCSVESAEMIEKTALYVRDKGAHILRGGVFKPRTGPYAFQGLGLEGLDMLAAAGKAAGLPIVTEVMSPEQVRPVAEKSDMLQIGARNMQNFALLNAVGQGRPPGPAQARHVEHHRGMAGRRRVHSGPG